MLTRLIHVAGGIAAAFLLACGIMSIWTALSGAAGSAEDGALFVRGGLGFLVAAMLVAAFTRWLA